jgi:hypothetical protein
MTAFVWNVPLFARRTDITFTGPYTPVESR